MQVDVPYATQTRRVKVPAGTQIIRSKHIAPLQDAHAAFKVALRRPIESEPLADLVRATDRVALVISDLTRPTPNHLLVPWLLEALNKVPREQFIILVGHGSHRAMTTEELVQMLGEEVVATVPIIIHDATDASTLVNVGATPTGVPVWVNRYYLEADVPEAEDGDDVMWAFVAHRQLFPASLEGVRGRALRDLVEQSMARWHPSLRRLVASSDEKTVEPFVFEAAPIKPWPSTNVTLLGDAIHAMPPVGA
jgi:hypothetical protein